METVTGFSSRVTVNVRERATKKSLTLAEKARLHRVERIANYHWQVTSGTSGKTYHVGFDFRRRQFTCSCNWGLQSGNGEMIGNGSGCSHILAVAASVEQERGRSAAFWASVDDARRQHRPIMIVAVDRRGNIVVETSRGRK